MAQIPDSLQGIFWSKSVDQLDLVQDKTYIIHQVLRFGSLADIKWLFKAYGERTVKEEFRKHPKAVYSRPALNFAKNLILGLEDERVDEKRYIQSFY